MNHEERARIRQQLADGSLSAAELSDKLTKALDALDWVADEVWATDDAGDYCLSVQEYLGKENKKC